MAYFVSLTVWIATEFAAGPVARGFWDRVEQFGLPAVLLVVVLYFANRQNEKRISEQRTFWADNNKYLRQLITELRAANYCRYSNNYGNEKSSID